MTLTTTDLTAISATGLVLVTGYHSTSGAVADIQVDTSLTYGDYLQARAAHLEGVLETIEREFGRLVDMASESPSCDPNQLGAALRKRYPEAIDLAVASVDAVRASVAAELERCRGERDGGAERSDSRLRLDGHVARNGHTGALLLSGVVVRRVGHVEAAPVKSRADTLVRRHVERCAGLRGSEWVTLNLRDGNYTAISGATPARAAG